ncbi:hypothetical protein Apa02nite_032320 [Actinoplanes palleronii]|uniref:von Hippel-Lindau disease tumour suppressor beta domain-containing protein n=1 Tax=Actinoplanes palleronii TaxID=113570 RepID=A0ABQ4B921_9ACTN|nr:hypothetical protein Apa02nite_032320 [Actinoplanes palleronii]
MDPVVPPRDTRRLVAVVIALVAVLTVGAAVLIVQLWPSGPAAVDAADVRTWPPLRALSIDLEASLRSTEDGSETTIGFINETGEPVTISWLGHEGERAAYATVEAGETYQQSTFGGHFWVASRADGTALAVFQATAEPGRAVIR